MLHVNSKPLHANHLREGPFWSIFAKSRIPMALIDRDRRYVKVNEAVLRLYQYPLAEILGSRAGRTAIDDDPSAGDAQWEQLLRTNELYGERIVAHADGTHMRVSYAAHVASVSSEWLALFVTLSARLPNGSELIGMQEITNGSGRKSKLTTREREVVRLVALGCNTRRIAADLSLSTDTIRSHVRNAMAKTGAHTRAQLVALALADGLIDD